MNKQAKLKQDQDVAKDDLTIILSYPHVYRFKPICYGMIVAVLNCHSSVITIMEKNDNILCINYTIKTGTVLCGGVGMFICCVGCVFMPCFCIFSGEKGRFIFKRLRFVDGYYLNILLDSLLTH